MSFVRFTRVALAVVLLSFTPAFGEMRLPDGRRTNLSAEQFEALARASRESEDLEWRVLITEIDGRPRTVVLLGEYHYALPSDLETARRTLENFDRFAVENGGRHREARYEYRTAPFAFAMMMPATILSQLLGGRELRSPMDFPMDQAGVKSLHNAEILHRPSVGEELDLAFLGAASAGEVVSLAYVGRALVRMVRDRAFRPHRFGLLKAAAAYFGVKLAAEVWSANAPARPLLKNRDVDMARFIDAWTKSPEGEDAMVVIVGRMHLKNLETFLTNRYHFQAGPLECGPAGCPSVAAQ